MRERAQSTARRAGDLLVVALFALALALPVGGRWLDAAADESTLPERRAPRPAPRRPRDLRELRSYPAACEGWLGDRFGFRGELIRWHNLVKVLGFGVSPSEELVIGPERWIFTASDRAIEAHRGLAPLSPELLELWKEVFEQRRDWLRERGARYLVAIGPGKPAIYPEQLPPGIRRGDATPLDQLLEFMARGSDVELLDLRAPLLAAKAADGPGDWLYYPFGTHWTERGNFVVYGEIARRLQGWFPELVPWPASDFQRELSDDPGDHWGGRLRMSDLLPQQSVVLRPLRPRRGRPAPDRELGTIGILEQPGAALPRALLIHDSFGHGLWTLLGEHFARLFSSGDLNLDRELVSAEAPEVVIQVMVERQLLALRPALWDLDGTGARRAFEGAGAVLFRLADPAAPAGVEAWRLARLTVGEPGRGAPLTLHCRRAGQGLVLPPLAPAAGRCAVLRVELQSSESTELTVLYKTASHADYSLRRSVSGALAPGSNVLHLTLPVPDLVGRLVLFFGARGTFELHGLELRACAGE